MSISAAEFLKWCEVFRVNFGGGGSPIAFPVSPTLGGTGVSNNAASTQTINGAFPLAWTLTGSTNLTLPESGTLATVGQLPSFPLAPSLGGTGIDNGTNTLTIGANSVINQDVSTTADVQFNTVFCTGGISSNSGILGQYIASNNEITAATYIKGASVSGDLDYRTAIGQTVTLDENSNMSQYFVGSGNATVVLPVTASLPGGLGWTYVITNAGTGIITVQSSGLNTVEAMAPGTTLVVKNTQAGGTGINQWTWTYSPSIMGSLGNFTFSGNTMSVSNTNGDINIIPNGTGQIGLGYSGPFLGSNPSFSYVNIAVPSTVSVMNQCAYLAGSGSGVQHLFNKSRSNTPGSFSAVSNGDRLFEIYGNADDGTQFISAARIRALASGAISTGIVPGALELATTNTSGVLTTALTIDNAQNATFAGTVASRGINLALGTLTGTGPYTPLNISATTTTANNTFTGINISHTNTNANTTSTGININIADNSASVVPINGVNCVVTESRATGASATSFASGKFTIATPSGAATLTNVNYYGVQGIANNQQTGGTTNTYAGHFSAVGPSTVYGVYASATGGSTNWGVYSAAGNNFFNGAITCNAWGTGVATALGQNVMGSGAIPLETDTAYGPVLTFGGASVGITYTVSNARYSRVGNTITVTLQITLSNKGSSTGAAAITLPGTSRAGIEVIGHAVGSGLTFTGQIYASVPSSSGVALIRQQNSAGVTTAITDVAFTNTTSIFMTVTYLM